MNLIPNSTNNNCPIWIDFRYEEGRAPVLLINQTLHPIDIVEANIHLELTPESACYYAWRVPNGSRSLSWGYGKTEISKEITKSASGSFNGSSLIHFYSSRSSCYPISYYLSIHSMRSDFFLFIIFNFIIFTIIVIINSLIIWAISEQFQKKFRVAVAEQF